MGYHRLAVALADHLGEGGRGNWCAFAVWASKQAGRTIRQEDLLEAVRLRLGGDPVLETALQGVVMAARELGSRRSVAELREALGGILDLPAVVDRTADAVARGNRRVFLEVGEVVAAFLDQVGGGGPEPLPGRVSIVHHPRITAPEGEDLLSRSLTRYVAFGAEVDPRRRAQLLFLGNLEIGVHEQNSGCAPEIHEGVAGSGASTAAGTGLRLGSPGIRSVILFPGNPPHALSLASASGQLLAVARNSPGKREKEKPPPGPPPGSVRLEF